MSDEKPKAPNNRTLTLSPEEQQHYQAGLLNLAGPASAEMLGDRILHQDLFAVLDWLPQGWVDLLFLDPPYNLTKTFNQSSFRGRSLEDYQTWLGSWLPKLLGVLKPTASVYICGDWRSAAAIQILAEKYLVVRNRITWEREKGRGAKHNWKNCSEDIWFCTAGDRYTFNAEAVRLRRRVIAPYTDDHGNPKDWQKT